MQNLSDYIFFKTEKCQEPLCESYQKNNHSRLPEKFADCYDYHNDQDKKRQPFKNLTNLILVYEPFRTGYIPDPKYCLNEIEFLYHPANYKAFVCNGCPGYHCPYYHTMQEKQKWDKLLGGEEEEKAPPILDQGMKYYPAGDKEVKRNENKEDEEEDVIVFDPSKFVMANPNNMFEVVDIDIDPDEDWGRERKATLDQIEEDHKLAMELEKQINNPAPQNPNTLMSLLQDAVGQMVPKEDMNPQQYNRGREVRRELSNGQDQSMASGFGSKEEVGSDEYLDLRLNESRAIGKEISYDIREYKKVHAITEADIQVKKNKAVGKQVKIVMAEKNDVPIFYGSKGYIYGEKVDITENRQNEFKCFRTNQFYEELLDKYVSGFLNSRGGTIYLGISDDGKAWGIRLDQRLLNELVFIFNRKFKSYFPPVKPEQYLIELCSVIDRRTGQIWKDQYVLHIIIAQGDPTELYFNDRELCYTRKQASTILLQPLGMKEELKARTKKQMSRNLVSALDDVGFDECLKRQSREDLEEIKRLLQEKVKMIDSFVNEDKSGYNRLLRELGLGKNLPAEISEKDGR